jgi:ribose transport system permease protein
VTTTSVQAPQGSKLLFLGRYFAVIAVFALGIFFSMQSQVFFTERNFLSILSQSSLLLIVAAAMTLVVRSGGIDLSVGVALDIGALTMVSLIADGYVVEFSALMGLLAGAGVGAFNATIIAFLKVSPFLTTLGTMFIGTSLQKVLRSGGDPIYLTGTSAPEDFVVIGRGELLGLPVPVWIAVASLVLIYLILDRLSIGRGITAFGVQPAGAVVAGLPTRRNIFIIYITSSTLAALAGVALAARLTAYVPLSGDYYLLDAIGAVFIGTTLSKESRPNIPGTVLGVLIFTILANGLNLIGLSFYWQGLARGVVLLLVLGLSVVLGRARVAKAATVR